MGRIWSWLTLLSVGLALCTGNASRTGTALLGSGNQAVQLMVTLLGTMPMWSGLMEILSASGDVAKLGGLFRRLLKPLFPDIKDEESWNAVSMNLSANLLGLGNAATPAGIEASKRLAARGAGGLRALAMLLVLDNASLQLLPTTVITMRHAAGAENPADIWGMTLLVGAVTMTAAAMMMHMIQKGGNASG